MPRLGIFWVVPNTLGNWEIRDLSRPASDIPDIGGFRTVEEGHVDVWPSLGRGLSRDYGTYPRGRVNWRAEDDRYLLLLDPTLLQDDWTNKLMERFALPTRCTLVLTDAHYRSRIHPQAKTGADE